MMTTKYQNFVKIVLVSSCYLNLTACQTSDGFDDDSINRRSVYREDDSQSLLPTPQQASEEARQYKVEEEKKIAERKKSDDEPIGAVDSDGKLNDLTAAYAQILVPQAQQEESYFAPVKKSPEQQMAKAMKGGEIKAGGTMRRKPVFLGKIGMEAMIQQAKTVNLNAPAAVTGGMMSLSARSGRGAGPIANRESMGSYIVQPGDTLSVISTKIYGTSSRWMELAHLNRLGNGSVIFPNELILYVPDKAAAAP
jgi:nucleoid-associated protein YgaU